MAGRKPSLGGNAFLNTTKTVLSIIFPIITFPYISRVLGTEALGQYTFSVSVISYFALLAALGINTYAIREGAGLRDNREALNRFAGEMLSINMLSSLLSYLLLGICMVYVSRLLGYRTLLMILSLEILLNTFSLNWVYVVFEDYRFITIVSIILQVISLMAMFLLVHSPSDVPIYTFICVISNWGYGLFSFFYAGKYIRVRPAGRIPARHWKPIFIIFLTSAAITIYINSDITILGWMRGNISAAIYGTASKIYIIVKQVLNAVVVVTIPRMSYLLSHQKEQEAEKLGSAVVNLMLMLSLPALTGLLCVSRPLIILYAGKAYADAALPLQILSIALIFAVLANFYANAILIAVKREQVVMMATVISALLNIGLNFILIPRWGEAAAAVTTVCAEFTVLLIAMIASGIHLKIRPARKNVIAAMAGSIVILAYCEWVSSVLEGEIAILLVSVFGAVILYFGTQVVLKNPTFAQLYQMIRQRFL